MSKFYHLDLERFEQLLALHPDGPAVLEHEDLMQVPQYELLKPYVEEDRVRATGQLMLCLVDAAGDTLADLWLLFLNGQVEFTRPPQVRIGRLRLPCGKEVANA